jgi:hypothetical protein
MNEEPAPQPTGRRKEPPFATPSSRPAPGALVRRLVATRGWANIDALAFIIFGILTEALTVQKWTRWKEAVKKLSIDLTTLESAIIQGEMLVYFAFAAGCMFAALKLFRYTAAISRLRQASRMQELERALRLQRTVWIVLGTVGAMWLLLFTIQLVDFLIAFNELENNSEVQESYRRR